MRLRASNCTKSQAAFWHQCQNLFEDNRELYFWTVTFYTLHADWECMELFSNFLNHLKKVMGPGWGGIRVAELHENHGVHFHLIITQRLAADIVRRVGRCHGIGRVHVKRIWDAQGAIDYLSKYLAKQKDAPRTKPRRKVHAAVISFGFAHALAVIAEEREKQRSVRKWATFGDVRRSRVKDMINDSPVWQFRREHNLPFLSFIPDEVILRHAWYTASNTHFKSCWFALRQNRVADAILLANEKLRPAGNGTYSYPAPWDSLKSPLEMPF